LFKVLQINLSILHLYVNKISDLEYSKYCMQQLHLLVLQWLALSTVLK